MSWCQPNCLTLRLGNLRKPIITFLFYLLNNISHNLRSEFQLNCTPQHFIAVLIKNPHIMLIWLVHFQFYFTGTQTVNVKSQSRNILILLWTQGVAGLMCITLLHCTCLILKYSEDIQTYFFHSDFIDCP